MKKQWVRTITSFLSWVIPIALFILYIAWFNQTGGFHFGDNNKQNSDVYVPSIYELYPELSEKELEACYAKASSDYSNRWMEQCLNLSGDFKCKLPADIEWSLEGIWASEQDLCDKLYDKSEHQK